MTSRGTELAEAVQSKLPNAKVFWAQPPDPFFHQKACTLVAVSRTDPNKRVEMEYKDGLGDHSIETLADDFVAHLGPELSD